MGIKAGRDHPPFYKFMRASTAKIVLENRTLRWSTPGTLNDPFDMQFDLQFPAIDAALKEEVQAKHFAAMIGEIASDERSMMGKVNTIFSRGLRKSGQSFTREDYDREMGDEFDKMVQRGPATLAKFHEEIRAFMSTHKVLCLTDRLDSVQQWSHYADEHRGIALEFTTPEGADSPWSQAVSVDYLDDPPLLLTREEYANFASGLGILDPVVAMDRIVYSKAKEWANEHEWRISTGDGRNKQAAYEDVPFKAEELSAVIFGCRIPPETKAELTAIAEKRFPHARMLQASKSPTAFRIDVA